jgi:hypothetical protein
MKRSIIAVAALLLLAASTTYATPPRRPRRPRFWGSVLCWFGFVHHKPVRLARPHVHRHRPPALRPEHRGRPPHGWRRDWRSRWHNRWERDDDHRRGKPRPDRPRGGKRRRGRG